MTIAEFFKDEKGNIKAVNCHGHAGYDTIGKDIVCAAISAMVGSCALGLKEVAKINIDYFNNEEKGECKIALPKHLSENAMKNAQILLKTLQVSLLDLEKGYKKYLKVKEYNYVY